MAAGPVKTHLLTVSALITFAVDQISKLAVVHGLGLIDRGEIDVLPPYLNFRMAWNYGINFGLLAGESDIMRWLLIAVALAISIWVWLWIRRAGYGPVAQISAGLLVGGALGNVVDRLRYGAVADFLNMSCCGIENPFAFNVADIAIFAGALGLVLFAGKGGSHPRNGRKG
ncbi:MAG: signal peptidase II [Rhodobacteraceae bacterium]|jgi:signal peptidase II|nr:signal peptidase II [Paracoccaceae bacterium]